RECGIVPIVDSRRRLVGVITDRDVCLAIASRVRNPEELPVTDVMTRIAHGCSAEGTVSDALQVMKRHHVRRLPVVDAYRQLVGLTSIDDVVAKMDTPADDPIARAVFDTLKSLAAHAVSP